MKQDETKMLLTTADVSKLLNVNVRTLRLWRFNKTGPKYVSLSKNILRYPKKELDDWLRERANATGAN